MLDYYGSFVKDKPAIYTEIISRFPDYKSVYIKKLLNEMYASKYLNDEISVSGWMVFVQQDVVTKIKKQIEEDTKIAEYKLLIVRLLDTNKYCDKDVMRLIAEYNFKT
tara:strand:+ start:1307 stop:1630 length:324 start_codon:yes stop_codon:yes gene_type:complete